MMFKKFEELVFKGIQSKWQRRVVLFGTLIALVGSILMVAPYEIVLAKMLPGKNNDTFNIYVNLAKGSSIEQTQEVTSCVSSYIVKEKNVLDTEVFLGMGSPLDFAGLIKGSQYKNSEDVAEIVVNITKKHHRKEPSYLMTQRLRPVIQANCEKLYPDTKISFVEPPAGPPTLAAIVMEVYGEHTAGIRKVAQKIEKIFQKTKGLVDIDIMQDEIYSSYELKVDSTKVAKSGVSVKQLNDILYLSFEGMQIAVKNSDKYNDQVPIYLSLSQDSKRFTNKSLEAIEAKLASLKLMNKKGYMIPLTELVKIVKVDSNPMIMTKDLHKVVNVLAETDMVSQVYPLIEARKMILKEFSKEYDVEKVGLFNLKITDKKTKEVYNLVWDGEMKVTIDTFIDLGGAFIAALVLIFLLMVIYYKSYTLSGIVLIGSFLSIIGVIVGHYIMDLFTVDTFFLTATSLIGFIALIGISSRNSLLLIDFTKSLMLEKGMGKAQAIAYATATRAKPIFLTAVAIMLASTLLAKDAVFGGLGVSLIFGTVAAVVASLIIVPVLLFMVDLKKHFEAQG